MPEVLVCRSDDIPGDGVRIVRAAGIEIGVYRRQHRFYAYRNLCLHQGGPVCEGKLMPKVRELLDDGLRYVGQEFDEDDMHIVCPWHGYEFRLETGECAAMPSLRLKGYDVVERDGGVYVRLPG